MCIACELRAFLALEDNIPPSTGTASHKRADDIARFACDTPAEPAPVAAQPDPDERKP